MTKIIDFQSRMETSDPKKTIVDTLKEAVESEAAKNATGMIIVFAGEDFAEHWLHNISDLELLWFSEMLKKKSLTLGD